MLTEEECAEEGGACGGAHLAHVGNWDAAELSGGGGDFKNAQSQLDVPAGGERRRGGRGEEGENSRRGRAGDRARGEEERRGESGLVTHGIAFSTHSFGKVISKPRPPLVGARLMWTGSKKKTRTLWLNCEDETRPLGECGDGER